MKKQSIVTGKITGHLPEEEQIRLIEKQQRQIKYLHYGMVLCAITFYLIMPIMIGIALYIAKNKEIDKLNIMKLGKLEVFQTTGQIGEKRVGAARGPGLWTLTVDNRLFPSVINYGERLLFQKYLGKVMTVEFIPSVVKNRRCYVAGGQGYNFITESEIEVK